jgi:hypothetical protein
MQPGIEGSPSMQTVRTVESRHRKSVFQVHGVDGAGQVVIRRQLKRRYVLAFFQKLPPCLLHGGELWSRGPPARPISVHDRYRDGGLLRGSSRDVLMDKHTADRGHGLQRTQ